MKICTVNIAVFIFVINIVNCLRKYSTSDILKFRDETKEMFYHAYNSYLKYAYPYDELRPISCDGIDTYGSYSLTLIDALDTLAIMGNHSEFERVVSILISKKDFDSNINVSVFETNIRIIGGLLSAHLLSYRTGVSLEPGWPCNGPLLRLAEDVAKRLLVAFDTPTGMPYGTVNLRHGVPTGETTVTCTAGIGTFLVEFGTLSRLTGDPIYEEVALNAVYSLFKHKSKLGLFGNHIDIVTGRWTVEDAGIGSGVDSFYEYLVKGAILLQRPELMELFNEARKGIDKYLKRDDWYMWVSMTKGQVTLPVFQSLEAFWPGLLSLIGETSNAMKTLHNYHQVWTQYGFTPEFYNIPQTQAGNNRENYPLRPELIESVMYLYRATGDPYLLEVGVDILRSLQHSAKTPCGYATIKDVRYHRKEDRMESFFLAETTKYLYLLFDSDNFIHNQGERGTIVRSNSPDTMEPHECLVEAGGYIFNTEAHPIDPAALHCCHEVHEDRLHDLATLLAKKSVFRGISIDKVKNKPDIAVSVLSDGEPLLQKPEEESEIEASSEEASTSDETPVEINGVSTVEQIDAEEIITIAANDNMEETPAENTSRKIKYVTKYGGNITNLKSNIGSESSDSDLKVENFTKSSLDLLQNEVETLTDILPIVMEKVVPLKPKKFDLQAMLSRLRSFSIQLRSNITDYRLMGCAVQPFMQRLSIHGEFFK